MLQADEKKAFEMMMAEIDSDSDEDTNSRRSIPSAVAKQAKYADERGSSKASPRRDHSNSDNHTVNSQRIVNQHVADSKPTNRASSSSSITHKRTKEEEEIDNFGKVSYQQGSSYNGGGAGNDMYSDISISKRWLSKACSSSETNTVKCFIEREKGTMGWQPTIYRCYLEVQNGGDFAGGEDGEEERPTGRFMMSAKRKIVKKNSSSYYLISVDMDPSDDRGSESVLGKLRGNSVGNHYLITDHGLAPGKTVAPSMLRREHGVVGFEFDSGGPSKIECFVPYVNPGGMSSIWQPDNEESGIEKRIEHISTGERNGQGDRPGERRGDDNKLFVLRNKEPKWDEVHGGHVLNFQGRVTESSVKNFQLVCNSVHTEDGGRSDQDDNLVDPEEIVLQFGRVGKNRFTMDFKFPLSPLQAFGICIACLDVKIADRKGYEYFQKMKGGTSEVVGWAYNRVVYGATPRDGYDDDDDDGDSRNTNTGRNRENVVGATGSVNGSSSIVGQVQEVLPSSKYIKDKLNRTFK